VPALLHRARRAPLCVHTPLRLLWPYVPRLGLERTGGTSARRQVMKLIGTVTVGDQVKLTYYSSPSKGFWYVDN